MSLEHVALNRDLRASNVRRRDDIVELIILTLSISGAFTEMVRLMWLF